MKCLEENPAIGLVDTWVFVGNEEASPLFQGGFSYQPGNVWKQMLTDNLIFCGSTPMVRRQCFETVGLFDSDLKGPEDWHMWVRIAEHYQFRVIEEPLVCYRDTPKSISKNCEEMWQNKVRAVEKIFTSVPIELTYLKRRNYANTNLYLASISYNSNKNYSQAVKYCFKALSNNKNLFFDAEYLRLTLKSLFHLWFGLERYNILHNLIKIIKS